jgi:hypothetical protein
VNIPSQGIWKWKPIGVLTHLTETPAFKPLKIYLPWPICFELHDVNCVVYSFSILVKLYISWKTFNLNLMMKWKEAELQIYCNQRHKLSNYWVRVKKITLIRFLFILQPTFMLWENNMACMLNIRSKTRMTHLAGKS